MTQPVKSEERWLTRTEAAALCRVSLPTFDKLRRDNLVPGSDALMGKHMLWKQETIDHLLESGGTAKEAE